MNAGERPAEDRRNALYMRAQQNSAAARLTVYLGVAAGLTAVESQSWKMHANTTWNTKHHQKQYLYTHINK